MEEIPVVQYKMCLKFIYTDHCVPIQWHSTWWECTKRRQVFCRPFPVPVKVETWRSGKWLFNFYEFFCIE